MQKNIPDSAAKHLLCGREANFRQGTSEQRLSAVGNCAPLAIAVAAIQSYGGGGVDGAVFKIDPGNAKRRLPSEFEIGRRIGI